MTITFTDSDGDSLGTVDLVDGQLQTDDPGVQSIVDSWSGDPQSFMDRYSDWSNGYVSSSSDDERSGEIMGTWGNRAMPPGWDPDHDGDDDSVVGGPGDTDDDAAALQEIQTILSKCSPEEIDELAELAEQAGKE